MERLKCLWGRWRVGGEAAPPGDGLETEAERRERWTSIRVIYFTMFLMSLGFSIILTGVWPYLDKLDPSAGKEFMGLVVGANPLGQMVFSPALGWWANRAGSIRAPLLTTLALFVLASGTYSSLHLFNSHTKYWMLWARFLVGVSSANIAASRSYLSAATRVSERTQAVSMVSLAQVLEFVVGPALQAAVTPLGRDGLAVGVLRLDMYTAAANIAASRSYLSAATRVSERTQAVSMVSLAQVLGFVVGPALQAAVTPLGRDGLAVGVLRLDMYTAAGWVNVLLGLLNFVLFLPFVFKERKIAAKEAMVTQGKKSEKEAWKSMKPDYISSWTMIFAFFVLVFNFVLLETLATSLTMDQFAWSKEQSLKYMGVLMSVGAVVAVVTFACIGPLSKMFEERWLLLWGGFLFTGLGSAFCIPWGPLPPLLAEMPANLTRGTDPPLGCPSTQAWCRYTPALTLTQFLVAYTCVSIGYPLGVTLIQTIFSKILGPRPQGVWMGLLTGSGCLSRVLGPVFVSLVYSRRGPTWTFAATTVGMLISMVWIRLVYGRLVPPPPPPPPPADREMQPLTAPADKRPTDPC